MTVLFSCGRTLSKQALPRSSQLLTRLSTTTPILRVSRVQSNNSNSTQAQFDSSPLSEILQHRRTYATATAPNPVGRPKAHTGRTTVKRKTAAKKTTTTKKPAAKKTKAKPKKKAKAKPKAKPAAKKRVLSEKTLARRAATARTDLRKKALLTGAPKQLPQTAWLVCFVENGPPKGSAIDGSSAKTAAQKYRNITPEEHEKLNHTANQNKTKNEAEHKKWVESFTPLQIKEANNARDQLKRQAKAAGKKTTYRHIKDERLVKQAPTSYALFLKDRHASGDMKGMKIEEIGKLIAREWKQLTTAQKKPYEDQHKADMSRYVEEFKSVYGIDPPAPRKKAAA